MDIKINIASDEHSKKNWILDYHQLTDIQNRLQSSDVDLSLEEIEAVLLASGHKEHLISM